MQEHFLFLKEDKEKNGLPEEKGEVTWSSVSWLRDHTGKFISTEIQSMTI